MTLTPPTTKASAQDATVQEARNAIENLRKSDFAKLMIIARSFTRARLQGDVVEPADLLHEAIAKTLDGRRRWRRSVSIVKHLDRVMESDSGHIAEQRTRDATRAQECVPRSGVFPVPSPETILHAREELDNVFALFADDKIALRLLRLKSEEYSASEIQRTLGMSRTEYDTVTKRIRRRLAKYTAEGGK